MRQTETRQFKKSMLKIRIESFKGDVVKVTFIKRPDVVETYSKRYIESNTIVV